MDLFDYDQILRQLVAAIGAALFAGNLLALVRRKRHPSRRTARQAGELQHAPVFRTLTYLVIGFVVMVWGIGSVVAAA